MSEIDPAFGGIPIDEADSGIDPAFGGQLVTQEQAPMGMQQPQQVGQQQFPQQAITQQAPQTQAGQQAQPKSMVERIRGYLGVKPSQEPSFMTGAAEKIGQSMTGEGIKEDYPEIGLEHTEYVNPFDARTDKGRLNLLKRNFKAEDRDAISMDYDKYGNMIVIANRPVKSEAFKSAKLDPGVYYLNKPGLSKEDVRALGPLAEGGVLPGATSIAMQGKGLLKGMGAVGLAGMAGETLEQIEAQRLGAEEGYSLPDIIKVGAFSAAGEGAGRVLAKTYDAAVEVGRRIMGNKTASVLDDAGNFTDDFVKAMNDKGIDLDDVTNMMKAQMKDMPGDLTPEQEMNKALWDALDIKPTRPMVTRDVGDFRTQEQLKGISEAGADVRQRLGEIDDALFTKLYSMKTGASTDDAITAMQTVKEAVLRKQEVASRLVGRQYAKVRDVYGDGPVDVSDLADIVEDKQVYEGLAPAVSVIKKRLMKWGVMDKDGKALGGINVTQAEELRKEIGRFAQTGGEQGHHMREIRTALDDSVLGSIGDDAFGQARAAAARNFREFKDKKIVKELIGDKWDDKSFIDKAIKTKVVTYKQLQELKDTLLTGSKASQKRGAAAFDDIRGATIKWIADQAKQGQAVTALDKPIFSGANFNKALETIGDRKLSVIFSKEEIDFLKTINKAGKLKTPIQGTINLSGTSSAFWDMANRIGNAFPPFKYLIGGLKAASSGAKDVSMGAAKREILSPVKKATTRPIRAGKIIQPAGAAIGAIEGGE